MPPTLKRHLISAGITFIAAFAFVILTFLQEIQSLSDLSSTTLIAIASAATVAALRAAAKYLVEAFFLSRSSQNDDDDHS